MLAFVCNRPLQAWWADNAGNRALLAGRNAAAIAFFDSGLRSEPQWALLHEDRGRALLESNPEDALREFERAACGPPCIAEEGDALVVLGRLDDAIARYVQANAVGRASDIAMQFARRGNYGEALAIERSVISHLHDDFVERSDLASADAALGKIEASAAQAARSSSDARNHERRAISAFQRAAQLAPLNEDYLLSYGFAQLRWGGPAQARAAFERLLAIHPAQPDAEAALARIDRLTSGGR